MMNNDKENKTHISHTYQVSDKVLVIQKSMSAKKEKLSSPTKGPFTIIQIYTNGNIYINHGTYEEEFAASPIL